MYSKTRINCRHTPFKPMTSWTVSTSILCSAQYRPSVLICVSRNGESDATNSDPRRMNGNPRQPYSLARAWCLLSSCCKSPLSRRSQKTEFLWSCGSSRRGRLCGLDQGLWKCTIVLRRRSRGPSRWKESLQPINEPEAFSLAMFPVFLDYLIIHFLGSQESVLVGNWSRWFGRKLVLEVKVKGVSCGNG